MDYLNIFYNEIIKEASTGRIDCFIMYNILFDTIIEEDNVHIKSNKYDFLVPTLIINNKELFNKLLIEYVNLAKDFYDLSKYEYLLNDKDNEKNISIEKVIMTLLWSNATNEDFENPIRFLNRRIDFMKDTKLLKYLNKDLGYSKILKGNIHITIEKDSIHNETPYVIKLKAIDENDINNVYNFPNVRLGISNNKAYIYAIQNEKNQKYDNEYSKKVNRCLFKIGENFIDDTNYEDDNLKDVTASFVISSNIVLSILENLGVNEVLISSILIERWNSKLILDEVKKQNNEEIYMHLQNNLTEKFLRTFRRIIYHNRHIQIDSYPCEVDSYLHLSYNNNLNKSNNQLLYETYNLDNKNIKK